MKHRNLKNHKTFVIAGIKNLLKRNYKIEPDTIDLYAVVDSTLTFSENWQNIKEQFVKPLLAERDTNYGMQAKALEKLLETNRKIARIKTIEEIESLIKMAKSLKDLEKLIQRLL